MLRLPTSPSIAARYIRLPATTAAGSDEFVASVVGSLLAPADESLFINTAGPPAPFSVPLSSSQIAYCTPAELFKSTGVPCGRPAFTSIRGSKLRPPSFDIDQYRPSFPASPAVYQSTPRVPSCIASSDAPETGHPPIDHLSSLTIAGDEKFAPLSDEVDTAICRKSPGNTCRQPR